MDCGGDILYLKTKLFEFSTILNKLAFQNFDQITLGGKWACEGPGCPPIYFVT